MAAYFQSLMTTEVSSFVRIVSVITLNKISISPRMLVRLISYLISLRISESSLDWGKFEVGVGSAAEPAAPEVVNNFSHPIWPESPFALYVGPLAAKIGLFSVLKF